MLKSERRYSELAVHRLQLEMVGLVYGTRGRSLSDKGNYQHLTEFPGCENPSGTRKVGKVIAFWYRQWSCRAGRRFWLWNGHQTDCEGMRPVLYSPASEMQNISPDSRGDRKMKHSTRRAISALAVAVMMAATWAWAQSGVTANPAYAKLLTATDVSKVTGLSGVQLVPRNPSKGAGGDLNFALPNGKQILLVTFLDTNAYNQSKAMKGVYGGDVAGVGDEAFIGKVMGMDSILYFRKGARGAALSSFIDTDKGWPGSPYVNQQQLRQLAALILSRM